MGFLGMMVDPNYGGGMDTLSYVLAMEEISKVDSSCSVIMSVNNSFRRWDLRTYGTEEQNKYLTKLSTGNGSVHFVYRSRKLGSDATSQRTTAIDMVTITCSTALKNWDYQWRNEQCPSCHRPNLS